MYLYKEMELIRDAGVDLRFAKQGNASPEAGDLECIFP